MSVESKVFDQLNKVELKSQKFEFAIVDEFIKSADQAKSAATSLIDATGKAEQLEKSINELQAKLNSQIAIVKKGYAATDKIDDSLGKLYDKAKVAAANLGMNIQDIKGYQDWWASVNLVTKALDVSDKYIGNLN